MIRSSHILLALTSMTGLALAQPPPPPPPPPPTGGGTPGAPATGQNVLGADLAVVLPTGDYADGADLGFGVFGRFEHKLNPQLSISGRLGVLIHIGEPEFLEGEHVDISMILLYGGARYNFQNTPNGDGLFGFGELGLNVVRFSFEGNSDSGNHLSLNLGAGYQTGKIQARGSLFVTQIGGDDATNTDSTTLIGLMGTVGFDFAAL
ncbi:MAG: hypothetical protein ABI867_08480 [Kofleriaceae bacterium]